MEEQPDKLVPPERIRQAIPITDEAIHKTARLIDRMFADGWNDLEIVYDLNRTNGVTIRESGFLIGPLHLVALLRQKAAIEASTRDPSKTARAHTRKHAGKENREITGPTCEATGTTNTGNETREPTQAGQHRR